MPVLFQLPKSALLVFLSTLALVACGSDADPGRAAPFKLRFEALVDGKEVSCADDLSGFGPSDENHVGINDLRLPRSTQEPLLEHQQLVSKCVLTGVEGVS